MNRLEKFSNTVISLGFTPKRCILGVLASMVAYIALRCLYPEKIHPKTHFDAQLSFKFNSFFATIQRPWALNNLGYICENGLGTEKNIDQAFQLYELAHKKQYTKGTDNYKRLLELKKTQEENKNQNIRNEGTQNSPITKMNLNQFVSFSEQTNTDLNEEIETIAQDKDPEIQFIRGFTYLEGIEVTQNTKLAAQDFQVAADQGHPEAQFYLGKLYYMGEEGFLKNENEGAKYFKLAYETFVTTSNEMEQYPIAQYYLGIMYQYGWGVEKNLDFSLKCIEKAIEYFKTTFDISKIEPKVRDETDFKFQNLSTSYPSIGSQTNIDKEDFDKIIAQAKMKDANEQFILGNNYIEGKVKNSQLAAQLLQLAADQGHAEAGYILGIMYTEGRGIQRDREKATSYFRIAFENFRSQIENSEAQFYIALMYYNGWYLDKNLEEAAQLFQQASDQGHPEATYNLGIMYLMGSGVQKNDEKASEYFQHALNTFVGIQKESKEYPKAQYYIGMMYYNGWGVPQNLAEAERYIERAADKDVRLAQVLFAEMNEIERENKKPNLSQSYFYYKSAADAGDPFAQYKVGYLHMKGSGCKKSFHLAEKYFRKIEPNHDLYPVANTYLASIYETGGIGSKDLIKACNCYHRAVQYYKRMKARKEDITESLL